MSEEEIAALLAWLRGHHEPDETVPGRLRWITLQLLKNLDERVRALEAPAARPELCRVCEDVACEQPNAHR